MAKSNSAQILDEVFDSFLTSSSVSRERQKSTTSSSVLSSTELGDRIERKEEIAMEGLSLSDSFKVVYGYDYNDKIIPISERIILDNNKHILDLIGEQKIYHINGLVDVFNETIPALTTHRIRKISKILSKRRILMVKVWTGRAKRTYGMILYYTRDCTKSDIESYMIDILAVDDVRLSFEHKNTRDKKSPEQIVERNKEVARLSAIKEKAETQYCRCGDTILEHYNKQGECAVKDCDCLEFINPIPKPELNQ